MPLAQPSPAGWSCVQTAAAPGEGQNRGFLRHRQLKEKLVREESAVVKEMRIPAQSCGQSDVHEAGEELVEGNVPKSVSKREN